MRVLRSLYLIVISIVVALSTTVPVYAEGVFDTNSNAYRTRNNIIFYSPNDNGGCSPNQSYSSTLTGNSNREKAFGFLTGKGLTHEQAAGVIGNLMVESGMVPDNQEDGKPWPTGGWGLAQWTGSRRTAIQDAVQKAGLPYTNEKTPASKLEALLSLELNFLWDEATHRGDIQSLKAEAPSGSDAHETIKNAVLSWERHYERAGIPALGARYDRAVDAYDDFGGSPGGTDTSNSNTSASACNASFADGDFVYYSQYDPSWASVGYGTTGATIQSGGCGVSSMAMIVATMTGNMSVTPRTIATTYSRFYIPGQGSSHGLFGAVASDYGLKATLIDTSQSALDDALKGGGLIVAGGKGSAPFTSGDSGHLIVIRKLTSDGKYLVGNPLPSAGDQGKPSADAQQNTDWYNREYSWSDLTGNLVTMYVVTKGDIST